MCTELFQSCYIIIIMRWILGELDSRTGNFDAFIANKDEAKANEAAAVAYLDSLDKNPNYDNNGACARAAASYIAEFDF